MATAESSASDDTESIKPLNEKYDLETGDEWKLIHQIQILNFLKVSPQYLMVINLSKLGLKV
jgi:hypothetical protein